MEKLDFGFDTRMLHAGQTPDPTTGARAMPIYQTTSFVFEDTEHAANLFALNKFGNIYTRISNPTTAAFEERLASLEGGVGGLATASGQAAQLVALTTLLQAGHEADIMVHTATRFIGEPGTCIGALIVDGGTFHWDNGTFPEMVEPSPGYHGMRYWETFGNFTFIMKARVEMMRDLGACLSPFNAFLFLQGLETLSLRMDRHVQNAMAIATWLHEHPHVSWVHYPGLKDSPYYALSQKYLPKGPGAIFTFGIKGGRAVGRRFIEAVKIHSHLANVGDAKSLVIHPGSTTHQQLTDEEQVAAGISPDMIRISIGLESLDDLLWDLDQALTASQKDN